LEEHDIDCLNFNFLKQFAWRDSFNYS